jgi:hypothetical protein
MAVALLSWTALWLIPVDALAQTVGAAPLGESAWSFIGRSEQDSVEVVHFGYLTRVAGLEEADLFDGSGGSTEGSARFTYYATTTIGSRNVVGNIITTGAEGTLTVYFRSSPGADFGDPESFAAGDAVASFALVYHNVLNVQKPNQGIADATVDLDQQSAAAFNLEGRSLRFGRSGLRLQLRASGQGTRTQPEPPRSFFLLGGNAVVAAR